MKVDFSCCAADTPLPHLAFGKPFQNKNNRPLQVLDGATRQVKRTIDNPEEVRKTVDVLDQNLIPEEFKRLTEGMFDVYEIRHLTGMFLPCMPEQDRRASIRAHDLMGSVRSNLTAEAEVAARCGDLPSVSKADVLCTRVCDFAVWLAEHHELHDRTWVSDLMIFFYLCKTKTANSSHGLVNSGAVVESDGAENKASGEDKHKLSVDNRGGAAKATEAEQSLRPAKKRPGRKRTYDPEVDAAAARLWKANKGDYATYQEFVDEPPIGVRLPASIKTGSDLESAIDRFNSRRKPRK